MELASAILIFIIEIYLKLLTVIAPVCSLWRYYNASRHPYIILLELILVLVVASITLASLSLSKMDCQAIANYFMLPVLLGLAYTNLANYHLHSNGTAGAGAGAGTAATTDKSIQIELNNGEETTNGVIDSVELVANNGLALLVTLQLGANLLCQRMASIRSHQ